jgi:predicted esterase
LGDYEEHHEPRAVSKPIPYTEEAAIYPPAQEHRQTFVILHGRGSWAKKFAPSFLTSTKLQDEFPHAKIIFPTAPQTRASTYDDLKVHQWFDTWHLTTDDQERTDHETLMAGGLWASCPFIRNLLEQEIEIIGRENVVLWGLTQGCAISLASLLTWDSEPFAAVVGMCGWLPLGNHIWEIANGDDTEIKEQPYYESWDPYVPEDEDFHLLGVKGYKDIPWGIRAVMHIRNFIWMKAKLPGKFFGKTPVFLGQSKDERVRLELGREAKKCLEIVGVDVHMVEYEGLPVGCWYSEEMLKDIFGFLIDKLGKRERED